MQCSFNIYVNVSILISASKCDFELGLCGYTQVKTDVFDWSRSIGGTSSSGTGPSSDHTYGTNRGKLTFSYS